MKKLIQTLSFGEGRSQSLREAKVSPAEEPRKGGLSPYGEMK